METKLDFSHVGICVKDFEVTKKFYEKLGFKVCVEPYETTWEDYWKGKNAFYKLPEGTCGRIFFMQSSNGVKLEFFEFNTIGDSSPSLLNDLGIHHIALKTSDINAVATFLKSHGIKIELGPVPGKTQTFLFFKDPDGTLIEVGQSYSK